MSTIPASPAYTELLVKFPPSIIRTEEQNERFIEVLYELESHDKNLTAEEKELADLLTLLIEDFEEKRYPLPKAGPLEAIAFLMDQHSLKAADLADVFGTPSLAAEFLQGKRELNKEQIARLSERFHVSPEMFF